MSDQVLHVGDADFEAQVLGITDRMALNDGDYQAITDFLCRVILKGCGVVARR